MSVPTLRRRSDTGAAQSEQLSGGSTRIGLFGEFGCGNVGNDASLDAMLQFLRRRHPGASLTCVCRDPGHVAAHQAIVAAPMGWAIANPDSLGWLPSVLRKVLAKILDIPYTVGMLHELDAVVIPGTGIFEQFGIPPWGIPLTLLRLALLARMSRTQLAYVSVGVEPATSKISKLFLRWALRLARYRSYRDDYSRDSAASLGVDVSTDPIFPDVAFGLDRSDTADGDHTHAGDHPDGNDIPAGDAANNSEDRPNPVIGVGVMGYFGPGFGGEEREAANAHYLDKLVRALQSLLDEGNDLRLLTADGADVASAHRVLQALRVSRPDRIADIEFAPSADIYHLEDEISHCDLVIASRYHNVIAALRRNLPVVSLGYAPKNQALLADLGLDSFSQDLADFDVDRLLAQVREAGSQSVAISAALRRSNARYREALNEQGRVLNQQFFAVLSPAA